MSEDFPAYPFPPTPVDKEAIMAQAANGSNGSNGSLKGRSQKIFSLTPLLLHRSKFWVGQNLWKCRFLAHPSPPPSPVAVDIGAIMALAGNGSNCYLKGQSQKKFSLTPLLLCSMYRSYNGASWQWF